MNKKYTCILLILTAALAISVIFSGCGTGADHTSSAVTVLKEPDKLLLGGWIFKNPDDEFQLMAFEFGPDSTFIVKQFKNGVQVGEKLTGSCTYLKVNGYSAIEMTLEGRETEYYYYKIEDGVATFTDADSGAVMTMYLVVNPNLTSSE